MFTRNGKRTHSRQERGIALLTALFALLLISGIAVGMMYMANTETTINYNYRDLQKADYAAYAGVQRFRLAPAFDSCRRAGLDLNGVRRQHIGYNFYVGGVADF